MHSGLSAVRSRHHPYVEGVARDVHGNETIPAQPVHEATREGGYRLFLHVSLSTILVSFRASSSPSTSLFAAPHENEPLTFYFLNKDFNFL